MITPASVGERLDNLPSGPFHRRLMWLVGFGMFFDSFDNTLSGSVLAALLHSGWSTLQLNAIFLSVTFVGLAIGAAFAGWLSDRFGRAFAFQINLALFGILAICSAFAPSMPWLIAIRGLMSVGMGAEYVMCFGLVIEFMPAAKRGKYIGILGLFAGAGVSITSLLGVLVIPYLGWRSMFILGGVGTLCVWWLRRRLPESPRWLARMGRLQEAEQILRRIELESGVTVPPSPVPEPATVQAPPRWVPITVLFSRPVIRRTLLAMILNITCHFGSYSISGWMPTFFVSQGMSVTKSLAFNAAMMAGYVAGPLLCVFIADRIGRRWGIVMFGVLCAVFGAIYPFLTSPALVIGCGFLFVSAIAAFLILGLGAAPEFFPTEYRFRGGGLAQTASRIGLILSPFIIWGLFNAYGIGGVIGAISGMYLIVAFLMAVAGIETNKQSLESLEPDLEPKRAEDATAPAQFVL